MALRRNTAAPKKRDPVRSRGAKEEMLALLAFPGHSSGVSGPRPPVRAKQRLAIPLAVACLGAGPGLSSCHQTPPVVITKEFTGLSAQSGQRIDAIVLEYTAKEGRPPLQASVSIVHKTHGLIFQRYYGGMNPKEPFVLASLSKTLATPIFLKLEQDGLLKLDAPIDRHGFSSPLGTQVTTAQLISNLAGLRCPLNRTPDNKWLCQFDPNDDIQSCAKKLWRWHQDDKLFAAPDTNFCYGGSQWQIAGAVAEMASGRSWSQLFSDTYRPCALAHSGVSTHFNDHDPALGDWSHYPHAFDPAKPTRNPNVEGGTYTTPADYSKLLLMFLRGGVCGSGRVLSEPSIDRILSDRLKEKANAQIGPGFAPEDLLAYGRGYGLGWWVDRDSGMRSAPGIYGSTTWISPDRSYAALIALKDTGWVGRPLFRKLRPEIDAIMAELDEGGGS